MKKQKPKSYMAADVLTKGVHRGQIDLVLKLMKEARFRIKPTDEMLAARRGKREAKAALN